MLGRENTRATVKRGRRDGESALKRESGRRYDIYIADDIDALKEDNASLRSRLRELVGELAEANERLNRYERAACYRESEREAANTRQ